MAAADVIILGVEIKRRNLRQGLLLQARGDDVIDLGDCVA